MTPRRGDDTDEMALGVVEEAVHAVGSLQPLAPALGCVVIRPDGTRMLAQVERDPLSG